MRLFWGRVLKWAASLSVDIMFSSTNSLVFQPAVVFLFLFAGIQEFGTKKHHRRRVCSVFFRNSRPAALFLLTGWQLDPLTLLSVASALVDIYSCSAKDIPTIKIAFCLFDGRIHYTTFSNTLGSNVLEPLFIRLTPPHHYSSVCQISNK